MKHISIGSVKIPLADYAVGASAILGIRDSGKTVTAKGICEQLIEEGIQPIIFDAVGKWRWLKVAGENGKGYKVVVVGGVAPDISLNPDSIVEVVRAALKNRVPLVIDLFEKSLSKGDWKKIVQQAVRTIHYENSGGMVHIFLEEAAEFIPQKPNSGDERVYAEIEKCVRMGGNNHVGITIITSVRRKSRRRCWTIAARPLSLAVRSEATPSPQSSGGLNGWTQPPAIK